MDSSSPNGASFKVGGRNPITFDSFIRGVIGLLVIVGVGVALYYLSGVLIPFFVAWVVAYLLYPVVRFLQKYLFVRNRIIAIIITLLLFCGLLGLLFYLIVPPMVEEFKHLKDVALTYIQKGADIRAIPGPVQEFLNQHANQNEIERFLKQENVVEAIRNALPKVWSMLMSTAGVIINIAASLIGLLYLLFILTDYEKYANAWIGFVPKGKRKFALQLVRDVEHDMAGYFRGQALVALSNCVMFSIGFWIIDFPVPIGLGCFIGVISFVPYLQVVGFLPAALLAILKAVDTGENFWWLLFLVLIVYLVVQVLQDTIFTPHIMGKIMGLPPAIILLALSVWGYAFGIVGLIIALPVTTLAISYYKRYVVGVETVNPEIDDPETVAAAKAAGVYVDNPSRKKPYKAPAQEPSPSDKNTAAKKAEEVAHSDEKAAQPTVPKQKGE